MSRPAPRFSRMTSAERRAALEEAALACMARGGILEFTIDKVCAEAGVSRGLITHHFQSKDGLLAAVYATMYQRMTGVLAVTEAGVPRIVSIVEATLSPELFSRETLNIWLTLWGEIANNPALQAEHRRHYAAYLADVESAIRDCADERGLTLDARALALSFICLVDGLGVQRAIEPGLLPVEEARRALQGLLEPQLGPLRP